jgi:hypothetical protein
MLENLMKFENDAKLRYSLNKNPRDDGASYENGPHPTPMAAVDSPNSGARPVGKSAV